LATGLQFPKDVVQLHGNFSSAIESSKQTSEQLRNVVSSIRFRRPQPFGLCAISGTVVYNPFPRQPIPPQVKQSLLLLPEHKTS
jgi:hypothetical protein